MVEVNLWLGLRDLVDGREKVEVEAKNIGELLNALVKEYPRLAPVVEAGVSVELIRSARHHCGNGNFGDLLTPVIVKQGK